jgi:hypothetical protein
MATPTVNLAFLNAVPAPEKVGLPDEAVIRIRLSKPDVSVNRS